jgi:hypothetical protein
MFKKRGWDRIQVAEIKYLRTVKGCTMIDQLRNENMRNELSGFPSYETSQDIETNIIYIFKG